MRFIAGDELGNLKALHMNSTGPESSELKNLRTGQALNASVQVLSAARNGSETLLAAGYSNGKAELFSVAEDNTIENLHQWTETRLKTGQKYVGLHCSDKNIFSCTSNGALRMTSREQDSNEFTSITTSLPTRLSGWRLYQDTFAYGGDEVDLSVFETERAFQNPIDVLASTTAAKKRKRNDVLFPGEIWRAKNVPNDNLGLRQPIRISALTYLSLSSGSNHHLLTGTQLGQIRRYDTRAARRPVSDWKVAKVGGIAALEQGFNPHEAFISDNGSNLLALDLRNGQVSYSYKGLAGCVTSIAPSPTHMASVAQDRYCRVHSTFSPPDQPGQQQEHKGEVLEKVYTKSMPTVVVWDGNHSSVKPTVALSAETGEGDDDDELWDNMEDIEETSRRSKTNKKRRNEQLLVTSQK